MCWSGSARGPLRENLAAARVIGPMWPQLAYTHTQCEGTINVFDWLGASGQLHLSYYLISRAVVKMEAAVKEYPHISHSNVTNLD